MDDSNRSTALIPAHPEDIAASSPDALVGATLADTYKVVRLLAEGGMGRVYEATHTRISSKRFAIKVLLAELTHSLDVRLRFRREAEAAASIDHPNVVGVHDFGYGPDGRPYLVCDYLEGMALDSLIEGRGPLPTTLAVSIVRQVCRGLEAAHDKGVIHRDVKPANVFLVGDTSTPDVRVLDFGLSRVLEAEDASVTQTGVVMGTPSYMAPEQARGQRVDHRADVYGAGAVLYACLTGKPPFEEESPHQTVLAVMSREPVRPCALVPSIPVELEVVVQKAMARSPDERFSTMRELEAALAPFAEAPVVAALRVPSAPDAAKALRPEVMPRGTDPSDARDVRRRTAAWIALGCLLLVLGFASAAVGVVEIVAPGRTLLPTEIVLVSLGILGSATTPGILAVRYLRRRYWNNSAKMLSLLGAIRSPVLAAIAIYGIVALAGRLADAVSRHLGPNLAPALELSGWLGWAPFLFGIALLAALGTALRQALLSRGSGFLWRFLAGPVALGLTAAAAGALGLQGYRIEGSRTPVGTAPVAVAAPTPITKEPDAPATKPTSETTTVPAAAPPAPAETSQHAPADEEVPRAEPAQLQKAAASGVTELTALQAKYPKDPAVLEALATALGKEPERASEMLRVLDTLFAVAPDKANDEALGKLVLGAALVPATSARAIEIMRARMGLAGAEMLFDIVIARPELRPRARAALESSEVQRSLSPALKIAYDLYAAPSCDARLELLPEAVRDGDQRAVLALAMQTTKTLRGCGPRKNKPCPAPCGQHAAAFDAAAQKIKARLEAAE